MPCMRVGLEPEIHSRQAAPPWSECSRPSGQLVSFSALPQSDRPSLTGFSGPSDSLLMGSENLAAPFRSAG